MKTRSPPASLPFLDQVIEKTTGYFSDMSYNFDPFLRAAFACFCSSQMISAISKQNVPFLTRQ